MDLVYKNGKLTSIQSRGNGEVGEDLTHLRDAISGIVPEFISTEIKGIMEIRGEVLMSKKMLEVLNTEKIKNGEKPFANTRNAAAGSLRLLDIEEVRQRQLIFVPHSFGIVEDENLKYVNHSELMTILQAEGFLSICDFLEWYSTEPDTSFITQYINTLSDMRPVMEYDIDGVVLKLNDRYFYSELGYTAKFPRFAVAYKFTAMSATTTLRDIILQVGRTGVITPVAEFDPIELKGVIVTRATLHNENIIKNLQIGIGDTITVIRSGDVIPKIVDCMHTADKVFEIPDMCPVCNGPTTMTPDGTIRRCINPECPAILEQKLTHFASRDAFNIQGMGEKQIQMLIKEKILNSPVDFFTFDPKDLVNKEGIGEVLATKLFKNCQEAKTIAFANFIYALGIPDIGITTAKKLAAHFKDIHALMNASLEELKSLLGGEVAATSIYDFFTNENNISLLELLDEVGVRVKEETKEAINNLIQKDTKYVVLTGKFSIGTYEIPRRLLLKKMTQFGMEYQSNVTKKTSLVVLGKDYSPRKKEAAEKFNIDVMDVDTFLNLIGFTVEDVEYE